MMVRPGALIELGDHSVEVLSTPEQTGDRYSLRIVADPGGGPGIKGDGPHTHPGLTELYRCVSGEMTTLFGKELRRVGAGEALEVPPAKVHGFVNSGNESLVLDCDVVFAPPGHRRSADVMTFAAIYDGLVRDGSVGRNGQPRLLQMAVLLHEFRDGIAQPGVQGLILRPLGWLGRRRGYRTEFPEYEAGRTG